VAECQLLNLAIARGPDAPPHGAAHSAQSHGRDLAEAYRLHSRLAELARAGARGGAGKGRKVGWSADTRVLPALDINMLGRVLPPGWLDKRPAPRVKGGHCLGAN
jgi:hypothetical protein